MFRLEEELFECRNKLKDEKDNIMELNDKISSFEKLIERLQEGAGGFRASDVQIENCPLGEVQDLQLQRLAAVQVRDLIKFDGSSDVIGRSGCRSWPTELATVEAQAVGQQLHDI